MLPKRIGSLVRKAAASGGGSLPVAQTFPLGQVAEAHRVSEGGHVRGKLALRWTERSTETACRRPLCGLLGVGATLDLTIAVCAVVRSRRDSRRGH